MFKRTFNQIVSIFIDPEIKARIGKKQLSKDFRLNSFQVIMFPNDNPPLVRLNQEVKAEMIVTKKEGVNKQLGEILLLSEIKKIQEFKLIEKEYLDCGHVTALRVGDIWSMSFDFRYNKKTAEKHLKLAKEFLSVSEYSLEKNLYVPFIDNLFSCVELAAKSILLSDFDSKLLKSKKHSLIHSKLNREAHIGNIKPEFCDLFNKLASIRQPYRYLEKEIDDLPVIECKTWLKQAKQFING
jgi:uncharacterized protein (UPF0332 family)